MSSVAQLKLNESTGKFQIWHDGSMITESTAKYYLRQQVKNGRYRDIGIHSIVDAVSSMDVVNAVVDDDTMLGDEGVQSLVEQFDIDERFEFVRDVTTAVANKMMKSAVILGEGGLGKSHTVLEGIEVAGLVDVAELEPVIDEETGVDISVMPANGYIQIKGNMTARGLFDTLEKYNGLTLLFDDCDSVLKDEKASMILKGALDSNDNRWITWGAGGSFGSSGGNTFKFTGTIIFVSNRKLSQIDQALRSRSACIDLSMTRQQKIERMWKISQSDKFMPGVSRERVKMCMDEVERLKDRIGDLNMRTLIKAVDLCGSVKNWQRTFEFISVTN